MNHEEQSGTNDPWPPLAKRVPATPGQPHQPQSPSMPSDEGCSKVFAGSLTDVQIMLNQTIRSVLINNAMLIEAYFLDHPNDHGAVESARALINRLGDLLNKNAIQPNQPVDVSNQWVTCAKNGTDYVGQLNDQIGALALLRDLLASMEQLGIAIRFELPTCDLPTD